MEPIPGPITLQALGQVLTSVGLSATLILFFIWQAWKREERLLGRLETLEEFTRTTLIGIAERSAVALSSNSQALQQSCVNNGQMLIAAQKLAEETLMAAKTLATATDTAAKFLASNANQ